MFHVASLADRDGPGRLAGVQALERFDDAIRLVLLAGLEVHHECFPFRLTASLDHQVPIDPVPGLPPGPSRE